MKLTLNLNDLLRKEIIKSSYLAKLITILIVTVQLVGCGSLPNPLPTDFTPVKKDKGYHTELERNRELWHESKIDNYNFVIMKLDSGTRGWVPSLIKIRSGKVISKKPTMIPGPMDIVDGYDDFDSVEKIFNQIQEAYGKGYTVRVRYNKELGYPEETIINHMKSTDSFFSIEVSKFEVIKAE
jgi:Family of unknown function (DUF6174)